MNRFKTIVILAFAVLTLPTAWADTPSADEQTRSRAVDYSDLDLTRPADVAVLYGRIERAAEYVCGPFSASDLPRLSRYARCRTMALDQAVSRVHKPLLTARALSR